jgi:hypothetical protein
MMFLLMVTIISLLLALVMSVIAWRVGQEERRRSVARVAALAAEIHETNGAVRFAGRAVDELEIRPTPDTTVTLPASRLFSNQTSTQPALRLFAVIGIGVLLFGSAVGLAVIFGTGPGARAVPVAATSGTRAEAPSSLELVALGHERDGTGLTVRGAVRMPSGLEIDQLTAIVFLFNRDGGFVASGRAPVRSAENGRGSEGTFVVTVPDANEVGRYRVSFRIDDRVVPHVDRREHLDAKKSGLN